MPKATIRLAYRQIIDAGAATPFEQQIFQNTWEEFRIQQQSFSKGQEIYTWEELKNAFPKSNPALPFKVSFAIAGAVQSLGNHIPGLQDTLGTQPVPFVQHKFELISSDTRDASKHQVSIIYITDDLTLFEIIGSHLLLSCQPPQTFLVKMQPGLSIISFISSP
ncbi:MAG: hypothetical protein JST68_19965 [Bacteroidetes bacterium]|nr:hypothetical protein [Bacteroidota bacterium]